MKITPVLFVEEIEPCLEFWQALGFVSSLEVPEGAKLGFVLLTKDDHEVMYQSFASQQKDNPKLAEEFMRGPTFLYVEVDSLSQIAVALQAFEVFLPQRTTFYGAKEVGYRDPAGHLVVFAEAVAAS